MSTATKAPDVIHLRQNGQTVKHETRDDNDGERGDLLKWALKRNEPGDKFVLMDSVTYDQSPLLLYGVTLSGFIPVTLTGTVLSDKQGGAFGVGNTTLRNLILKSAAVPAYEDDRCVSFDQDTDDPQALVMEDCEVWAGAWGIYGWRGGARKTIAKLSRTKVYSACQCISFQGSGADDSNDVSLADCTLDVDASRAQVGASQSVRSSYGGCLAVPIRAGKYDFKNTTIRIRGGVGIANCAGITDTYENGPRDSMKVIAQNLTCSIEPNGTPLANCWDVRLQNDKVRAAAKFGGKLVGSGEFDSLRMWAPGSGGK